MGLVTPPSNATVETYDTKGGTLTINGYDGNYASLLPSIKVAVVGSDIYISGLAFYRAYYGKDSWIKGTINDDGTATFPTGQQVDDDETYPEWLNGSDDGSTITDIVFAFDQEAGTLTQKTTYILETAGESSLGWYSYWENASFSKNTTSLPLPYGALTTKLAGSFISGTYSTTVYMAVNGDDVYIQGLCSDLPNAWIKGTLSGKTLTIPTGQYFGQATITRKVYDLYFVGGSLNDVVFTFDDATGQWTTNQTIYVSDNKDNGDSGMDKYESSIIRLGLTLSDSEDNSTMLEAWKGFPMNITLGRTINAGGWNTLTVPFGQTAEQLATIEGIKVKELIASSIDDGTLTLTFADATNIEAGKPYLVKLADDAESVTNPTFTGVVQNNAVTTTETAYVDFVPVMNPTAVGNEGDAVESILFVGAENKLYNPTELPARMKGLRAYFNVHDEALVAARRFVLDIEGEGTTEVYEILKMNDEISAPAYNLAGQRVDEGYKGIVIVNGKKIVK